MAGCKVPTEPGLRSRDIGADARPDRGLGSGSALVQEQLLVLGPRTEDGASYLAALVINYRRWKMETASELRLPERFQFTCGPIFPFLGLNLLHIGCFASGPLNLSIPKCLQTEANMHLNKRALQLLTPPQTLLSSCGDKKVQRPFGVAEKFIGSLENTIPERPPPALCRRLDPFPAVYCAQLNTGQRGGGRRLLLAILSPPLLRLAGPPAQHSTGELTLATATSLFYISLSCEFECNSQCDGAAGGRGGGHKRCQITDNSAAVQLHKCAAAPIKRRGSNKCNLSTIKGHAAFLSLANAGAGS